MAKKKNYKFTNKKHSDKAIMSTILGIISLISIVVVIYLTYARDGDATAGYGATGVLATLYSITGLIMGINTAREKELYRLFPWLGIILNVISLIIMGLIVYIGAYI